MTATLKRKLTGAQADPAGQEMTALRALRLSLARAGADLYDLALGVLGARQARATPDDVWDALSDDDLLILMDCPGGTTGAAAIGLPLVSAVIQQQTLGQVSPTQPDARPYTDTDAAMCAPLIEGTLTRACSLAEADQTWLRGARFGARSADARSLFLGLRARRYRVFWLTVDIALGLRQADVMIVLPEPTEDRARPTDAPSDVAERAATSPMLNVRTDLQAELMRFTLSVAELNALKVGDCLPVPKASLTETKLVGLTGDVIARGHLGQMNGDRALRLLGPAPIPQAQALDRRADFRPEALDTSFRDAAPTGTDDIDLSLPHGPEDLRNVTLDLPDDPSHDLQTLAPTLTDSEMSDLAELSADDLAQVGMPSVAPTPSKLLPVPVGDIDRDR